MRKLAAALMLLALSCTASAQSTVPPGNADALPIEAAPPDEFQPPAESVVAGLSSDSVAITASFDGSDILIYGAIKRETPIPDTGPLDVIVTVEGPARAVTVRHKERRFGIWVNTGRVSVASAPNFYVVATTRPLDRILEPVAARQAELMSPLTRSEQEDFLALCRKLAAGPLLTRSQVMG